MRTWRNQHPEADVPAWFDEHCEDNSWCNDAMPIFHYNRALAVFVDYADPDQSEFAAERRSGRYKRFSVVAINPSDALNAYADHDLFQTDCLEELKAWLSSRQ